MAALTRTCLLAAFGLLLGLPCTALGQPAGGPAASRHPRRQPPPASAASPPASRPGRPPGLPLPTDYVIGPDDVLGIVFWRDADMTGDVTVRPDGNITLPLLRDVKAAGLRPDELREQISTRQPPSSSPIRTSPSSSGRSTAATSSSPAR